MTVQYSSSTDSSKSTLLDKLRKCELPRKLRANQYPIEPSTRAELSTLLSMENTQIHQYDVEIARLQTRITQIENAKQELHDQLSYLRSLFSPIRKLPQDILVEIFSRLDPENGIQFGEFQIDIPFLRASHACAHWRNIIHSTKSLWSKLTIDGMRFEESGNSDFSDWIIAKSGDYPLDIRFLVVAFGQLTEGLTPLVQLSQRWVSLHLCLDDPFEFALFEPIQDKLPALTELELDMRWTSHVQPHITTFDNVPQLKKLTLSCSCDDDRGRELQNTTMFGFPGLPWKQLTELKIRNHEVFYFKQVISECPNLVYLELDICDDEEFEQSCTPVTLAKLQTLCVVLGGTYHEVVAVPTVLPLIFQSLTLPSLSSLIISVNSQSFDWPTEAFEQLCNRSKFTLSSLSIATLNASITINLHAFFRLLPSLTSLSLYDLQQIDDDGHRKTDTRPDRNDYLVSTELISHLRVKNSAFHFTENGQNGVLLPRLQNLTLNTDNEELDQKLLVEMIRSRYPLTNSPELLANISDLKNIRLDLINDLPEDILEQLRTLQLTGLNLTIGDEWQHWGDWN